MKNDEKILSQEDRIDNFRELLDRSVRRYGEREAFILKINHKEPAEYRRIIYKEFRVEVDRLGTALTELGLKGAKIGVIGENRYEWCLSYLAVTCGCGVIVPIDKELHADEVAMILNQSEAEVLIFSGKIFDKNLQDALKLNDTVRILICMDEERHDAENKEYFTIGELLLRGARLLENGDRSYLDAEIDSHAMSVLLFTSGTTGVAKGVMLSQRNICADIESVTQCLDNDCTDSVLSILPIHHTYECTCDFLEILYMGARIAFCDGLRYIAKNVQEYQPTILMLVPLIIENVYSKIMKQASSNPVKRVAFRCMLWTSGGLQHIGFKNAGRKMFRQVHETLGGRLRLIIAGAAAMNPKISKDMNRMGFKLRQGYGLTECSPILCVSRDTGNADASVGPAMPRIEVKIVNQDKDGRGEIVARGENIMLGYYRDPEATAAVLKEDGWFYTGDRGYMDKYGRVYITGRIKNMIVNKTGKNIYPEELEEKLMKIPYILECVVWGDDDAKEDDTVICATIVPKEEVITEKTRLSMEDTQGIHDLIWKEVKKVNKGLPTYKKIQRLVIRREEFEKTTTKKIKRYLSNITKFFTSGDGNDSGSSGKAV